MAKMCDEVGLSEHAKNYLMVGRSLKAVMVFAKVAKNEDDVVENLRTIPDGPDAQRCQLRIR